MSILSIISTNKMLLSNKSRYTSIQINPHSIVYALFDKTLVCITTHLSNSFVRNKQMHVCNIALKHDCFYLFCFILIIPFAVLCSNRVSQMTKTYNDIEAVTRLLEEVSWVLLVIFITIGRD